MSAPIARFVAGSMPAECKRFVERVASFPDVARVAVMPDVHLAGDACVGTAVATRGTLRPALLGSDLGCGVVAVGLGVPASALDAPHVAEALLEGLRRAIPLDRHPTAVAEATLLPALPLSHPSLERLALREGRVELGTIGRGNHFVEIQEDEEGALWLMAHTGSRAMGPAIQAHHARGRRPHEIVLDASLDEGQAYLADLRWALVYAETSRRLVAQRVQALAHELFGAAPRALLLDCHHDSVALEEHDGELLFVHRKGAVAASEGATVLVPGSMGTASYHAVGRGHPASLRSSAHGAGRLVPRGEARRRFGRTEIDAQLEGVLVHPSRRAELGDELPSAYKDVRAVMRAQRELVRQQRRLVPRIVHK